MPTRFAGAALLLVVTLGACTTAPPPEAPTPPVSTDPRYGLEPGWRDAEVAVSAVELVAHRDRPAGFFDPDNLGDLLVGFSDMAFRGDLLFVGSFHGFNIYDISNPSSPTLRTSFVCPGGQGDPSIYGDLLFISVEMPNARIDCGTQGTSGAVDPDRFRGVRIFDVSDIDNPRQVAAVQTCRGSHTHTLVTDEDNDEVVWIYVSGTAGVRPEAELAGCSARPPAEDTATAYFRIEIIEVPLSAPQNATIVNAPRIFADPATGEIAGLWPGGGHGAGSQETSTTNQCHDITVYPHYDIAAGACSGNGILLDISDPVNPVRIDEVLDPNFAYWHSANFNNDATTVLFTDEWGGGGAPRCLATDNPRWGANAIFRLEDRSEMELAGYFKLPVPQTELENCVAHNGSIIPVPGRDIMAQAWYQGGMSIFDFTDPANPYEIAYFDRGPIDARQMQLAGLWSTYWYNGRIYGSEIGRGLDVFRLTPSEHLTQNEIDAAESVVVDFFNAQHQDRFEWPATFTVARALLDQLARGTMGGHIAQWRAELDRIEALAAGAERRSALTEAAEGVAAMRAHATGADARRLELLSETLSGLAQ
ncbi:MAG TPA: hypothetical protein VMN78_07890 [Longimicrobiales bacterium]|nr:hypothetical protein [Longimicrobiales bacterium]